MLTPAPPLVAGKLCRGVEPPPPPPPKGGFFFPFPFPGALSVSTSDPSPAPAPALAGRIALGDAGVLPLPLPVPVPPTLVLRRNALAATLANAVAAAETAAEVGILGLTPPPPRFRPCAPCDDDADTTTGRGGVTEGLLVRRGDGVDDALTPPIAARANATAGSSKPPPPFLSPLIGLAELSWQSLFSNRPLIGRLALSWRSLPKERSLLPPLPPLPSRTPQLPPPPPPLTSNPLDSTGVPEGLHRMGDEIDLDVLPDVGFANFVRGATPLASGSDASPPLDLLEDDDGGTDALRRTCRCSFSRICVCVCVCSGSARWAVGASALPPLLTSNLVPGCRLEGMSCRVAHRGGGSGRDGKGRHGLRWRKEAVGGSRANVGSAMGDACTSTTTHRRFRVWHALALKVNTSCKAGRGKEDEDAV